MAEPGAPRFVGPENKEALITELQDQLVQATKDTNFLRVQLAKENIARMIMGELATPDEIYTPELGERIGQEAKESLVTRVTFEAMGGNLGSRMTLKEACETFKIPDSAVKEIVIEAARTLAFDDTWGTEECKENAKKLLAAYNIPETILSTEK